MFSAHDLARLEGCLARLVSYVDVTAIALTGGVAVEYHLAAAGRPGIRSSLADLDFVVRDGGALRPEVTRAFLVSHYHVAGPGVPKALVQLVDPVACLRVDIFPDVDDVIANASSRAVGGTELLVLDLKAILAHKLRTVRKASAAAPVDPKHWNDAAALADIGACPLPEFAQHFKPISLSRDLDAVCERCRLSESLEFPLAPKRDIFAILGYV